ncbi:2-phospho-L-lactate guanylyltransferase [Streptomyces mirabilis]|jgi:2-phospho-L-lactate guanylyltransferase|uniref:2-phospho-L-lactate guanylyltransferase n=1 Tax=Streptomyces TaxID=1883 RepID=UPI0029B4A0CA|nr:2-phospho-L-lactate guanylyltransferase [Streptomyces sp. AK02-04a]MDX3761737.1 2-phospho-L-lactate guanylyltransferase [Streptomyces sp. AK02-04a]
MTTGRHDHGHADGGADGRAHHPAGMGGHRDNRARSEVRWAVVIPQKDLRLAKSRLALDSRDRQRVASALFRDTVAAARHTPGVSTVIVVVDRIQDLEPVAGLGVGHVLGTGPGLNGALRQGELTARAGHPGCGVAALPADLPLIEPAVLARALAEAGAHDRAFLPDADDEGTTLLTARPGHALGPVYGNGSRRAHRRSGAVELTEPGLAALRYDLDCLAHLALVPPLARHTHLSDVLAHLRPVSSLVDASYLPDVFGRPAPPRDRDGAGDGQVAGFAAGGAVLPGVARHPPEA